MRTDHCSLSLLCNPPLPLGGDRHFDKKAQEIPGAEAKFSSRYIGTAAVLVLHCVVPPPPPKGGVAWHLGGKYKGGGGYIVAGEKFCFGAKGAMHCWLRGGGGGRHLVPVRLG